MSKLQYGENSKEFGCEAIKLVTEKSMEAFEEANRLGLPEPALKNLLGKVSFRRI